MPAGTAAYCRERLIRLKKVENIVRICNDRESRLSPVECLPGLWPTAGNA
jgi:hypothetical protein